MKTTIITSALFATLSLAAPLVEKRLSLLPVRMGVAAKYFGALASTTLTSTGPSAITADGGFGNVGVWPGSEIVGFPIATASGSILAGTTLAESAQSGAAEAYAKGLALDTTEALASADLVGLTLGPGVYSFPTAAAALSGNLTLDAGLLGTRQFIFKIDTTFAAAAASQILLVNGARACNVFFLVGSSVTIEALAKLQGNIIAYTSIAAANGATGKGTWAALNGGVSLINNQIVAQAGLLC